MEHFEPLYASGTNDMVELWPSEISTLRISLWISPYGILPLLKYKAPEAGGGPTEHDAPQLLVVARQLLESHPTVLTFKTRSRSDTAVETSVVEAALELSGSGVINLLHDLDIDASIGLNGEHYIGRLVSLFYLFLFSPSPPSFSLS